MNTYTIKPGDTLQSIAFKLFGDESFAQYLASINGLSASGGSYLLPFPGQTINVGVAEVQGERISPWPWAIGASILAGIIFRKQITAFVKKAL